MLLKVLAHNFIKQRKTKKEFHSKKLNQITSQNLVITLCIFHKMICKSKNFFTCCKFFLSVARKKTHSRQKIFVNRFCFNNSNPVIYHHHFLIHGLFFPQINIAMKPQVLHNLVKLFHEQGSKNLKFWCMIFCVPCVDFWCMHALQKNLAPLQYFSVSRAPYRTPYCKDFKSICL